MQIQMQHPVIAFNVRQAGRPAAIQFDFGTLLTQQPELILFYGREAEFWHDCCDEEIAAASWVEQTSASLITLWKNPGFADLEAARDYLNILGYSAGRYEIRFMESLP